MSCGAAADATTIRRVCTVSDDEISGLAELLIDCVDGGASVSFMHPLPIAKAVEFWRHAAGAVARSERALLVAEDARGIVGTVQLLLAQPQNQPHRADVSKMLVHRRARRQGVGTDLMRAAETLARECGVIPGYALWPRGGLCDTTYFYREIAD
jgi:GNAT superfamily N-acetyltransferase